MNSTVLRAARITVIGSFAILSLFLMGCPCEEYVKMVVLAGHQTAADCERAIEKRVSNDVTIICPGEEVTVCWASNQPQVQIEPGLGTHPDHGVTWFKPTSSTTVTATVPGSCASSAEVLVTVVDHDTPSTWDAHWDSRECTSNSFEIDPLFVSPNVFAKDALANWEPSIVDAQGNKIGECPTPPFLKGFQQESVFGFEIDEPFVTYPFSRLIPAVGHYKFSFVARDRCPAPLECSLVAPLPYNVTLSCR